ncbi:MAG TPA: 30S ribosome-binding factor RbfA [Bacteroidales bacterium]|nr:30S ribosome-binding factor RbfA [Bacteroidales bacterium]
MESIRQNRVARLLQRQLGDFFLTSSRSLFDQAMITVTHVRMSKDLSVAKVFVSIFATGDKNAVFAKINTHNREIRYALAHSVKNQLRSVPELMFYIDDSLDYIDRIDELLKK